MKFFSAFLVLLLFSCLVNKALAQDYTIDGGVIPNSSLSSDTSPAPVRRTGLRGLFEGANFKIQVGFERANNELPMTLSLSENLIDYGEILPTDPIIRTNNISVSNSYNQGYTLQAFENHPLSQISSSGIIPDTTCDNGICSDTVAQPWNGTLTYGFGYRCDKLSESNYCLADFSDTTSFKQFAKEVEPQKVIEANRDSSAQISYKINLSGAQATKFYNNKVTFIAIPNF